VYCFQVGTHGFQGKSSHFEVVGPSPEDMETNRELITSSAALGLSGQGTASSASIPDIRDSSVYLIQNKEDTFNTSSESLFGAYDESTHTITIVVPCEDVYVEDAVQEVITSDIISTLSAPVCCTTPFKEEYVDNPISPCSIGTLGSLSPAPCSPPVSDTTESCPKIEQHLSDCGYESLDSPQSEISGSELADIWSESFSCLFPTLM
jgi:hypothetical protein